MTQLIKVRANMELFTGVNMRKTPFVSGYRPLFSFGSNLTRVSGKIELIDLKQFEPGTKSIVNITFIKGMISDHYFRSGSNFTFSEGQDSLGKGHIIEVINEI